MKRWNRFIHQQNVENFREQLAGEADPSKRAVLEKLLAEEIQKQHDDAAPGETERR